MHTRIIAAGLAAALSFAVSLPAIAGNNTITVSDPFARETPPNAKVGGVYMTFMNTGAANRLVGARSDAAKAVQIHKHLMDDAGVMRMREVEGGVALGEDETVVFAPGGLHVMLMGLKAPLKKNETVGITLDFEDGSSIYVAVPVKSIAATDGTMDHDHGKKKHEH